MKNAEEVQQRIDRLRACIKHDRTALATCMDPKDAAELVERIMHNAALAAHLDWVLD